MNLLEELDMMLDPEECDGHEGDPERNEAGTTVYCDGSCRHQPSSRNHRARVLAQVRALLRRDWAVRVLDAWARAKHLPTPGPLELYRDRYMVELWHAAGVRGYEGPTPDAARHTAALAAWPTLSAEEQARIGECP